MNVGRSVRCFASLLALGACSGPSVFAQSSGGQISMQAVQAACSADAARLCSNVATGGGRVIACLKQHQDEFSDGCHKAGGLPLRSRPAQPAKPLNLTPFPNDGVAVQISYLLDGEAVDEAFFGV